jgi:hypothetical protein
MPSRWWERGGRWLPWREPRLDVTAIDEFFGALAAGRETLGPGGGDGYHVPRPGSSRMPAAPSRN